MAQKIQFIELTIFHMYDEGWSLGERDYRHFYFSNVYDAAESLHQFLRHYLGKNNEPTWKACQTLIVEEKETKFTKTELNRVIVTPRLHTYNIDDCVDMSKRFLFIRSKNTNK